MDIQTSAKRETAQASSHAIVHAETLVRMSGEGSDCRFTYDRREQIAKAEAKRYALLLFCVSISPSDISKIARGMQSSFTITRFNLGDIPSE